ncbi:Rhodanese domain protein [Xylanimonas cellulosilytica DSM 15894]|uniref:Rhodanese domain protein n=1 Tax=Xylanimonas cellulosilytica (strain DSM 15894 / JCM 12276 / CECT 5975 / KCTC 9989 / LMG 20990 / NBRC 107835 / XIL07) TaxID=446471 RepID=D1BUF2_XYLCX|nr:rhodanese-like domain-containing protein [Xylanimonas cellulosilytica]ACZ31165.1 Rhodanese domain protein [Xylanimonas cellulosilytica DSM 15894]
MTSTDSADRVAHFASKLTFETDPSDVVADRAAGVRLTVVDVRSAEGYAQGHVPGALHIPLDDIADRAAAEVPIDLPVVVYCWGPGCNGSTHGALRFARLGYDVKEMIGGYEYWVREGLRVQTADGSQRSPIDPLTAVA